MSKSPRRFNTVTKRRSERIDSVKPFLKYFIGTHKWIVPVRLQKLVFYAEVLHYEEHGERLTEVEWKPFMYGMHSQDITDALERLEHDGAETTSVYRHGKVKTGYLKTLSPPELSDETEAFLDEIQEETSDISTEDLTSWHKRHPLFDATEYDTVVDFSDFD